MERGERRLGRSRLWRGVTVVAMSLGLTFAYTTPSQAVDIPVPTIPLNYAPETLFGTAVVVTGLATTGLLAAPVVAASAAMLTIGGGAVYWASTPPTPAEIDVKATFTVDPYLSNGQVNYTVRHPNTSPTGSTTHYFRAALVKTSGGLVYDSFCTNSTGGGVVSIGSGKSKAVGSTDTCYYNQNTSDPYIGVLIQYRIGGTTGTYYVVESATVSNTAATPGVIEQTYKPTFVWGADQNAAQRLKSETTCSGQTSTVVTYSSQFFLGAATRPHMPIGQGCPIGSRPTNTVVTQEESTPHGWYPSPWAPKDVQCGGALPSTSIRCVPGFIASVAHSPAATDPSSPVKDCVTGSKTCEVTISKGTADCKTAGACPDYAAKKDQVAAGTTTWQQTDYVCKYDGSPVDMASCVYVDQVAVNTTTSTTPTPTNGFECGWSLTCYVSALFVPSDSEAQRRIVALEQLFMATPLGVVPQALEDFRAPFDENIWEPDEDNCQGPTLTLPKNMGVEGTGVHGDYVIQPLYACSDTEAGQFGAQISGYVRGILGPTVYVAGVFLIVNTILGAMGMALPMFVNGYEVNPTTGETPGRRWHMRTNTTHRSRGGGWRTYK